MLWNHLKMKKNKTFNITFNYFDILKLKHTEFRKQLQQTDSLNYIWTLFYYKVFARKEYDLITAVVETFYEEHKTW
jgi:hypothetical protein